MDRDNTWIGCSLGDPSFAPVNADGSVTLGNAIGSNYGITSGITFWLWLERLELRGKRWKLSGGCSLFLPPKDYATQIINRRSRLVFLKRKTRMRMNDEKKIM